MARHVLNSPVLQAYSRNSNSPKTPIIKFRTFEHFSKFVPDAKFDLQLQTRLEFSGRYGNPHLRSFSSLTSLHSVNIQPDSKLHPPTKIFRIRPWKPRRFLQQLKGIFLKHNLYIVLSTLTSCLDTPVRNPPKQARPQNNIVGGGHFGARFFMIKVDGFVD